MSKFIDLDQERLSRVKTLMFKEVMDKAFKTNVSKNFSGSCLLDLVGGSMESMRESLNTIENPTQMQGIIKAVITTIDNKVDNYASKKGYRLYSMEADETSTEEEDDQTVFDDADTEIQKGDDQAIDTDSFDSANGSTDALADTVKELFEDLAQKQAEEIRNLSKTVLKLEKIKQDEELKNRKAEDGEFIDEADSTEENKDKSEEGSGEGDSGNPFGDGSEDNQGDDSSEGGNPFGDSGDEGSEGESGEEGGNPFDSGSGDSSDGGDESNPFGDSGEGGESEESNPFDDESSDDGEASFESMIDYPNLRTTLLGSKHKYSPFDGLTKGDIKNYAKYISNEIMGEKLSSAYASESMNELNSNLDKYKKLTGNIIKMMSDTLAVSAVIGLPIDKDRIKYPYL